MNDWSTAAKASSTSNSARNETREGHHVGSSQDVSHVRKYKNTGGREVDLRKAEFQRAGLPLAPEKGDKQKGSTMEEVERLRAMNAQMQLHQHRERLAKQLEGRDGRDTSILTPSLKSRVSHIHEETTMSPSLDAAFASPVPSGPESTSTESVNTIKGGNTPTAWAARTPSYPFPSMRPTRQLSTGGHRPFTALSPTGSPVTFPSGSMPGQPQDHIISGPKTPASTLCFQAPGVLQSNDDPNFENPNLYELSLMLSSEPGLDAWWTTVVQVMKEIYKADRVTLSIPADSTDIENVPWGQKATFNVGEEDGLSVNYLPRGSSQVPSSADTNENSYSPNTKQDESPPISTSARLTRPSLSTRHSFGTYEETKRASPPHHEAGRAAAIRPSPVTRAKSCLVPRPDQPPRTATLQNAELNLESLGHLAMEHDKPSVSWEIESTPGDVRGRVFEVLQALDYETDPLIDSAGVLRVLERGRVVALTRDYPYLDNPSEEKDSDGRSSRSSKSKDANDKSEKSRPEFGSRMSSFLGGKSTRRPNRSRQQSEKGKSLPAARTTEFADDDSPPTPRYEEYEQAPPSPWAQSPAPSPAVRAETDENPFFANISVVEESFNPEQSTEDYSKVQNVETIGVDQSLTVLHIPLMHPLLSKPVQSFRLDAAAMESKSGIQKEPDQLPKMPDTGKSQSLQQGREKQTPIAILSILSPVIPYISNLRHSLEQLSPHLATSFSLCRHYSNLETEISGLSRKRPHTAGFGAVAAGPRSAEELYTTLYSDDSAQHRSMAGSMTSPSEYSGVSRSAHGSPGGTPGWEFGSVLNMGKRSTGESSGYIAAEGYFTARSKPGLGRLDTGSRPRRSSKESSTSESKQQKPSPPDEQPRGQDLLEAERNEERTQTQADFEDTQGNVNTPKQSGRERSKNRPIRDAIGELSEHHDKYSLQPHHDPAILSRLLGLSNQPGTADRHHRLLHSYGADFGATFQSLPVTSATSKTTSGQKTHSRKASASGVKEMPPPSDRLKGLMLDSLPAHVFVALPQSGEIVWVNNRYLTYRGQTVSDLFEDPWGSIHPDERDAYLKAWTHAVKTGEQFSMQVRIRRFDGTYRWFYTRAVGSKDIRGVIVQWYGSHMDIHDQHIAEVKAARQEEVEASEAKHRQLANLIPQIIFAATEDEGVTFANEQWLSYTGQEFDDALGLGFMDYIHPEDLAKCQIPIDRSPTPRRPRNRREVSRDLSQTSKSSSKASSKTSINSEAPSETTVKGVHQSLSRHNSSSSDSVYEVPAADLSELARKGIVRVANDSNGRLSYATEVRIKNKKGEYRWHLVRCVEVDNISLGSGDGSWFGACTDINDHKLLESKLKEAMETKGKFLSNMSHEIRTPLIGISGMVNFLQDTVLNDEQMDYTNTIQSSASSLLNIINDILDLSKVDAGMMKLSKQWFYHRSLVEEVNEMVSTMAISKRLELNYVVDEDVPEMVKGDKFRIRQVLLNVVGNAIKFTEFGEVFSRCRVCHEDTGPDDQKEIMLEYSIIDTGRGFSKEEADLMFKPFSQIDGSSTRQHGGSGLGLVISRQLVELHGGQMQGTAIPGKGSTFTFTAKFGLPTPDDRPEVPLSPPSSNPQSSVALLRSSVSLPTEVSARAMKQAGGNPILANKLMQSPMPMHPKLDSAVDSPAAASSSSSEAPSLRSIHSGGTHRSSASSVGYSLEPFSEAAQSSGQYLSKMKLALPEKFSPTTVPSPPPATPSRTSSLRPGDALSRNTTGDLKNFRPPMYSILLICPQTHSREATTQHIEITLPKDVPHQITPLPSVEEAQQMIGGEDPVIFTHIVLNLPSARETSAGEIIKLIDMIINSPSMPQTSVVVLSDPFQRQAVMKMAAEHDYEQLAQNNRVMFVYKPVKPSRFAVIFDPDKVRDMSRDRNRSSAEQHVANQKQNYVDVAKRLGNRGLKILLVEDNLVNQKVLFKFLGKVGIAVELALDGIDCTEKVFSHPHSFYSLILCDLHMPRKDGYQTCREIREWEAKQNLPRMPIIALSANVMADVLDKCVKAGFNSYVTKPVDFKELSAAMSNLLDPQEGEATGSGGGKQANGGAGGNSGGVAKKN